MSQLPVSPQCGEWGICTWPRAGLVNTLTAVGSTSINGGAPPLLFGAYNIVYVDCGRRLW